MVKYRGTESNWHIKLLFCFEIVIKFEMMMRRAINVQLVCI